LSTVFVFKGPEPLLACDLNGLSIYWRMLYESLHVPGFGPYISKKTNYNPDINPFNGSMSH
jgi:hypothetical protein